MAPNFDWLAAALYKLPQSVNPSPYIKQNCAREELDMDSIRNIIKDENCMEEQNVSDRIKVGAMGISDHQMECSSNDSILFDSSNVQNLDSFSKEYNTSSEIKNRIVVHEDDLKNETKTAIGQTAEDVSDDDSSSEEEEDDSSEESDESSSEESSTIDFENDATSILSDDDAVDQRKQSSSNNASENKQKSNDAGVPIVDFNKLQLKNLGEIVVPEGTIFKQAGTFMHAMEYDRSVVVESIEGVPTFHLGTILFRKNGEILGEVCDIIGNVKRPYYSLNFKTMEEISEKKLEKGEPIFFAPTNFNLTTLVRNEDVITYGTDASGVGDREASEEEFSDDDQESKRKKTNPTTSWPADRKKVKVKRNNKSGPHAFQQRDNSQKPIFPLPTAAPSFLPASNYPTVMPGSIYHQNPPAYLQFPPGYCPPPNPHLYNTHPHLPAFPQYPVPQSMSNTPHWPLHIPPQPSVPMATQQWPPQPTHSSIPMATQQWPPQRPPYQNFNPYHR